jgi:hypothetical protein
MHACWILLCMSLNLLSYVSLLIKKVSVRVQSPRVGLKVAYPSLWVAGDVTFDVDHSGEKESRTCNITQRPKPGSHEKS